MKEHPEDICECGDYRRQHLDNGACSLNGLGHGTTPGDGWTRENDKCLRFRFDAYATESAAVDAGEARGEVGEK